MAKHYTLTREAIEKLSVSGNEARRNEVIPTRVFDLDYPQTDIGVASSNFAEASAQSPTTGDVTSLVRSAISGGGKYEYKDVKLYFATDIPQGTTVSIGRGANAEWHIVSADC